MQRHIAILIIILFFIFGCSKENQVHESVSNDGINALEQIMNRFFLSNTDEIRKNIGLTEDMRIDSDEGIQLLYTAASSGDIYAQFWVGTLMIGMKDSDEVTGAGLKWLELAASQGIGEVECVLALYYYDKTFSKYNIEKGAFWLEKAANNEIPEAEYFWGLFNYMGYSVSIDSDKGISFIKKAYDEGFGPELQSWSDYKLSEIIN